MTDKLPNAFTMPRGTFSIANDKKMMQSQRNKAGGAASAKLARPQEERRFQEKMVKRLSGRSAPG